jgi:ABC-type branched-subunit amino acid transport system substrate-binding protein/uncharacterized caspase-like protein
MAKIALLVGVSEYEPGLNPLPAAVRDVEALQKVLLDPAIGDFAESDVVVLKNPDRQTMEEAIATLFRERSKDDLLLLFFSGHGIKDDAGELFLATSITRKTPQGDLIDPTAVKSSFIQGNMSRSRSKRQVVILDSCFSGAFAKGLLARDDGTIDIRSQLGGEGRAVLTSSSSTQYSFEDKGSELSLYTRFLIEGLETGAADTNKDEAVSVHELHEYVSGKVKEIKPELRPEFFVIREGFTIRLTKVPAIDPQQKYRREVARLVNYRGEISSINRRTLNIIKNRLQLDEIDAQAIEHEILEPIRLQFTEKLHEYELAFGDVIQNNENPSDSNREDLEKLRQVLELRDGDTRAIESKVKAHLQSYRQHLQEYEEVFRQALKLEYPLSDSKGVELQQIQQKLALKETDIESIEAKITAEMEAYYRHLEQYKQLFIEATNQEYPPNDAKRHELLQQQERLDLSDLDVSSIEAEITTEIETYQQKLDQYQQAFVSATQAKYLPISPIRKQLQQTWQTLGLTEADVKAIESPIIAQINLYQQSLEQYKREFDNAVQQQYPLGEAKCNELTQLKLTLNLNDDDVNAIESPIKAAIAEHWQKLQQYEETFLEAVQHEFPLTEENSQDLKRLQQVLEISKEDAAKIEERVINKFVPHEEASLEAVQHEFALTEKNSRDLERLQPVLEISKEGAAKIKERVINDVPPVDPNRPTSRFFSRLLNQMITKLLNNSKLILGIIGVGIASTAVVSLIVIYFIKSPKCSKETGDFISEGEEILNYSEPYPKSQGAVYYAKCNYEEALSRFKDAWQSDKLDPETLIYLNNALLEEKQAKYYTIAIAVSIPRKNSPVDDSRAKEMLRGVAQLQTETNLGLFNANDPLIQNFPGQGVLKGKTINGKGLKVIITNDENDKSKAKQRAEALSKRLEILGVVGHYPSEMTLATVDIFDKANLVLISPGTTTQDLTKYPRKNFLRTVFSVAQQSPIIAKFLQEKSIKKAVGFYSYESPFSHSFYTSFITVFKQPTFGGTIVKLGESDLGKPDFNEEEAIRELRRKEGIVGTTIGLVLFPDAVGNAQNNAIKLIELNKGQNWVIGSWGLRSPSTLTQIDNLKPFQKFVIAVPWDSLTSPNQDFLKDVKNLWGTASVNAITAFSYDATLALTKALEEENNPTRINIRDQLKAPNFSVDGGATGTIEFNPENGDRKNPSVEFVHIVECRTENLDFAFVPIKYSTAKDAGLTCLN